MNALMYTGDFVTPTDPSYPCKTADPISEILPCRIISYEELEKSKKKNLPAENKKTCPNELPVIKEFDVSKICQLPYTRRWDAGINLFGDNKLSKKIEKKKEIPSEREPICYRALDSHEKKLRKPICKINKRSIKKHREPIDKVVCVFCSKNFYTGGYFHEICEKIPLIKKQSEEYGDDMAWRIGTRTRVLVHKKCYDFYINRLAHKKENKTDTSSDLSFDDYSDLCGEERISKEEIVNKIPPVKRHFCLKKCSLPLTPRKYYLTSQNS